MTVKTLGEAIALDTDTPVWERFFSVAPLVVIGTRSAYGEPDLAPKHMVTPLGWGNFFGFVCTPRHTTWRNIERTRHFAVSYPRPSQLLFASLAASPRCDDSKPVLSHLDTVTGTAVDAPLLADSYVYLECVLHQIVAGFGDQGLIAGRVVAAHVHPDALRSSDRDDQELIHRAPLLAYLPTGRFATVERSNAFPFPAGMRK